jgi:hypothetical protein
VSTNKKNGLQLEHTVKSSVADPSGSEFDFSNCLGPDPDPKTEEFFLKTF